MKKHPRILNLILTASTLLLVTGLTGAAAPRPVKPTATIRPPTQVAKPAAPVTPTDEDRFIALIEKALPSVVSIVGRKESPDGKRTVVSRGTGFIVDQSGFILTNRHVVGDETLTYTAYLPNDQRYPAVVVARDPLNDLAILHVTGDKFPALPLGDSDKIRTGQTTIAIGNSLGRYANTVTRGIVSGIGRSITASDNLTGTSETLDDVIQTDAEINLGNSGGPLLSSRGEVIGINTAIEQQGRGVGFAIPINEGKKALASYRQHQRIVRPILGVRYHTVTIDIQDEEGLRVSHGAYLTSDDPVAAPPIVPGGPAERAGLRAGDIILSVDGKEIRGTVTLLRLIQARKPGDTVTLVVARGAEQLTVQATLDELPKR